MGIRGKIIVDKEKYIIQIGGDSANSADFNETEMNLIVVGPGYKKISASFKEKNGMVFLTISFSDQIEISKNMLDKGISICIDNSGDIPLDSSIVNQFKQTVSNQMGISTTRDWRKA